MQIDLSSDVKWFKRLQKQFNETKSDIEKLAIAMTIRKRAIRLEAEMGKIADDYSVKATHELEQAILKVERA